MIGVMVVASNAAFANLTPQEVFLNPPKVVQTGVWWYRMDGQVAKDGVEKKLDWFVRMDISIATIFGTAAIVKPVRQDAIKVSVSTINPQSGARLFGLEFVAVSADGRVKKNLVFAEGFNHSPERKKVMSLQTCIFVKDEFGEGDVRFTVMSMNCFGTRGKPLFGEYKV